MGTLVVEHHKSHHEYYERSGRNEFGSLGSSPSANFRGIDCRTFHTGGGLLPTPLKSHFSTTPKRAFSSSPKTPLPFVSENQKTLKRTANNCITPVPVKFGHIEESFHFNECWSTPEPKTPSPYENQKSLRRTVKSATAPIPIKINFESKDGRYLFYERWAGPAYCNSPPPSSLPLPKFSVHPKRTVSLDLPSSTMKFNFHPIAKSAPTSPRRECSPSPSDFFDTPDCATKNLRRILNLDLTD